MSQDTGAQNGTWAQSLDDWKLSRLLDVTLPSGMRVTIIKLTLDELVQEDALPDDLVRVALLEISPGGVEAQLGRDLAKNDKAGLKAAKDLAAANLRLQDRIVLRAVVAPKIEEEQLPEVDPYDKAMIAGIACGRLFYDEAGRRIGPEPMSTFREHARTHHPDVSVEDCEACQDAIRALSAPRT